MNKIILDSTQINQLVMDNNYEIDEKTRFISRCIDGRYDNNENLPALAIPGADAGEIALILATSNNYGLEIDREKAYEALIEVIGGAKNFQIHTDSHAQKGKIVGGCGHISQITLTPSDYHLENSDIEFIKSKCAEAVKNGAKETVLNGDHRESAVLMVEGNRGIYPSYELATDRGTHIVQIFVYHQSLVNERHKALAKKLIDKKAVVLPQDCKDDYLYQALSEISEIHLMETAKRLAIGLPIYRVVFRENGEYKIEEVNKD